MFNATSQEQESFKPKVITIYNPNDYLHLADLASESPSSRLESKPLSPLLKEPSSTTLLIPPKKGKLMEDEISTGRETTISYSNKDLFETNECIEHNNANCMEQHCMEQNSNSHIPVYSVSGTQRLDSNEIFNLQIEFPIPRYFHEYKSGKWCKQGTSETVSWKNDVWAPKSSNRDESTFINGRMFLRPIYKLGTFPLNLKNKDKFPVHLTNSAVCSDLEIDEVLKEHPPAKKVKLDLSYLSNILKENEHNRGRIFAKDLEAVKNQQIELIKKDDRSSTSINFLYQDTSLKKTLPFKSVSSSETEDEMNAIGEEYASTMDFTDILSEQEMLGGLLQTISETPTLKPIPHTTLSIFHRLKIWPENRKSASYKDFIKAKISFNLSFKSLLTRSSHSNRQKLSVKPNIRIKTTKNTIKEIDYSTGYDHKHESGIYQKLSNVLLQKPSSAVSEAIEIKLHDQLVDTVRMQSERDIATDHLELEIVQVIPFVEPISSIESLEIIRHEDEPLRKVSTVNNNIEIQNSREIINNSTISKNNSENNVALEVHKTKNLPILDTTFHLQYVGKEEETSTQNISKTKIQEISSASCDTSITKPQGSPRTATTHNNECLQTSKGEKDLRITKKLTKHTKKVSFFKTIVSFFHRKEVKKSTIPNLKLQGKMENLNVKKKTFLEKLGLMRFRKPQLEPPISNTRIKVDSQAISTDPEINKSSQALPNHVDSISIIRKKRMKLFEEAREFYHDSILAYRNALSQVKGTAPDSRESNPYTSPAINPNLSIMNTNPSIDLFQSFGYKSTVSESVILPVMSRRKRRLNQYFPYDEITENKRAEEQLLKGILINIPS